MDREEGPISKSVSLSPLSPAVSKCRIQEQGTGAKNGHLPSR